MKATKIQLLVDKDFDKRKARSRVRSKRPTSTSPDGRLTLASTVGNRAFGRLLQAKLTIGAPNDKYEQEADRVADAVIRMPEPDTLEAGEREEDDELRTKTIASQITPLVQRVPDDIAEGEEEDLEEGETAQEKLEGSERVQREEDTSPTFEDEEEEGEAEEEPSIAQANSTGVQALMVPRSVTSRIKSLRSGGQPLPPYDRSFFESRMGHDFSQVRIHTDADAVRSARSIRALAFTLGHNVFFGAGQYQPATVGGRRLIAHELVHAVQQSGVDPQRKSDIKRRGSSLSRKFAIEEIQRQSIQLPLALAGVKLDPTISRYLNNYLLLVEDNAHASDRIRKVPIAVDDARSYIQSLNVKEARCNIQKGLEDARRSLIYLSNALDIIALLARKPNPSYSISGISVKSRKRVTVALLSNSKNLIKIAKKLDSSIPSNNKMLKEQSKKTLKYCIETKETIKVIHSLIESYVYEYLHISKIVKGTRVRKIRVPPLFKRPTLRKRPLRYKYSHVRGRRFISRSPPRHSKRTRPFDVGVVTDAKTRLQYNVNRISSPGYFHLDVVPSTPEDTKVLAKIYNPTDRVFKYTLPPKSSLPKVNCARSTRVRTYYPLVTALQYKWEYSTSEERNRMETEYLKPDGAFNPVTEAKLRDNKKTDWCKDLKNWTKINYQRLWTRRPVFLSLTSKGITHVIPASQHGAPHQPYIYKSRKVQNNYPGHLCLHFRDTGKWKELTQVVRNKLSATRIGRIKICKVKGINKNCYLWRPAGHPHAIKKSARMLGLGASRLKIWPLR